MHYFLLVLRTCSAVAYVPAAMIEEEFLGFAECLNSFMRLLHIDLH